MKNLAITLALLIILTIQAFSQEQSTDSILSRKLKEKELGFNSATFSPNGNSAFSNVISNFSLSSALDEGVNARIELKYKKGFFVGGLTMDQKIGKTDKKATFYDFTRGMSPGTTIGLSLQYMNWSPDNPKAEQIFNRVRGEYLRNHPDLKESSISRNDILNYGSEAQRAELLHIADKNPIFVNFNISFTKTKFAFATDSVSIQKIDETHLSPELSLAIGIPFSVRNYLAFRYSYSESYEGADEVNFTRPFGTTSNMYAQTIAFGKPIRNIDHKITGEYRQTFKSIPNLAIAPAVTYGISSEKIAFSFPVYFIKGITKDNKANGLQGGINFGYLSRLKSKWSKFEDGFGAQLIVTAPFSMFDGLF